MRCNRIGLTLIAAVMLADAPSPAQALDDYQWRAGFHLPGISGTVRTVHEHMGRVFVGGDFGHVEDAIATRLVIWENEAWQPLPQQLLGGSVHALASLGADLIVGGNFGPTPGRSVAAWTGSNWRALGQGVNGTVYCMAVLDGVLIVGGSFLTSGTSTVNNVAMWNGTSWVPMGSGFTSTVRDLAIFNGELYAAGAFGASGSTLVGRIARWDGSAWQPVSSGVAGGDIAALEVFNGRLIAGGSFTHFGIVPCNHIAAWNGSQWSKLNLGVDDDVTCMTTLNDRLVVGGEFLHCGVDYGARRLAVWRGDSWEWLPVFGSGIDQAPVSIVVVDEQLIVTGAFAEIDGRSIARMARWDGATWRPMSALYGQGLDDCVRAITVHEGRLVIGGQFRVAGGDSVERVAEWNGSEWLPLGGGANSTVRALLSYDGELIAGGWFSAVDGVSAARVASWNGAEWRPLGSGLPNMGVYALAEFNGDLYAGGEALYGFVARWDGTTWETTNFNSQVQSLCVHDGALFVGGRFTALTLPSGGQVGAARVARWDGTSWSGLPAGPTNRVYALASYQGDLVAAGWFGTVLRWDGSAWATMGTQWFGDETSLAVFDGGIVVGGSSPRRWNGTTWEPLGSGVNGGVDALYGWGPALIVGGSFTQAGERLSNSLAWWEDDLTSSVQVAHDTEPSAIRAYPNPCVASDGLRWTVRAAGPIRCRMFDIQGRLVRTLWEGAAPAGGMAAHSALEDVSAGVYFVRVDGPSGHANVKVTVLR